MSKKDLLFKLVFLILVQTFHYISPYIFNLSFSIFLEPLNFLEIQNPFR